jgi:hypothetical protein
MRHATGAAAVADGVSDSLQQLRAQICLSEQRASAVARDGATRETTDDSATRNP